MRIILLAALLLVAPSFVLAETCPGFGNVSPVPLDTEQITVTNVAVGFTAAKVTKTSPTREAIMAVVSVETGNVRYRDDGTAPTATVGQLVVVGQQVTVCGRDAVLAIKFIRQTATSGVITASYYRRK